MLWEKTSIITGDDPCACLRRISNSGDRVGDLRISVGSRSNVLEGSQPHDAPTALNNARETIAGNAQSR
jgi:hypothetical protein